MVDVCQVCDAQAAVHTHHRKLRSQGGTNNPENIMRLCADCHQRIHDKPAWAYEYGLLLKSWQDETTPVEWRGSHPDDTAPTDEHEHEGKCEKCGLEIKSKPRKRFKGEARRTRSTISLKVPKDAHEDGAGLLDEAVATLESKISGENPRPVYFTIMDALNYTLLNAGEDDFA